MRIMVARSGGTVYAGKRADKATPVGDTTGGVMGLVRYLNDYHDVCMFGSVRGNVPNGVKVIQPDTKGLDELSLVDEVTEVYQAATDELAEFKPEICLNVIGPTPTCSWIGNPRGVGVQMCSVKYTAPILYAIQHLGLPRVSIVHDPRSYSRDHEMLWWPHTIPVACISLERRVHEFRTLHQKWQIHIQRSLGENWWSYKRPYERGVLESGCVMIAHGHFKDNRLRRGRVETWQNILHGFDRPYTIFGKDWDVYPDPVNWGGVIKPGECREVLLAAKCGPIVPIRDRFVTSKLRQYVLYNALPFLYGRGQYLTYDYEYRYVPQDADIRFSTPQELEGLVDRAECDEEWRLAWIERLRNATLPNFSVLEHTMANWRTMKGYVKC